MLGVEKSIRISEILALPKETPIEGKIAWGNTGGLERGWIPLLDGTTKDLSPHHAGIGRERSLRLEEIERWTPPLPLYRDRHRRHFSQQTAVRGASPRRFGVQVDHK